jgi:hypothetical protein
MAKGTNRRIEFGETPAARGAAGALTGSLALGFGAAALTVVAAILPFLTLSLLGESESTTLGGLLSGASPLQWPPALWMALGGMAVLVLTEILRVPFALGGGSRTGDGTLGFVAAVAGAVGIGGWVWMWAELRTELSRANEDLGELADALGGLQVTPAIGFWVFVIAVALAAAAVLRRDRKPNAR